jgi:hypothetical protein
LKAGTGGSLVTSFLHSQSQQAIYLSIRDHPDKKQSITADRHGQQEKLTTDVANKEYKRCTNKTTNKSV